MFINYIFINGTFDTMNLILILCIYEYLFKNEEENISIYVKYNPINFLLSVVAQILFAEVYNKLDVEFSGSHII